jgi:hypothetical protein
MPSPSPGTQPADVPYAITVVGSEYYSIKELKVELSVATMILIVQKAGIKKNIKNQDSNKQFISSMCNRNSFT